MCEPTEGTIELPESDNMAMVLLAVGGIAGLVSLVCWIMVLVAMFKNGQVGLGIVSIFCGIVALIVGWMNADKWGIKNVMIAWTIAILVGIVAQVAGGAMAGAQAQ